VNVEVDVFLVGLKFGLGLATGLALFTVFFGLLVFTGEGLVSDLRKRFGARPQEADQVSPVCSNPVRTRVVVQFPS
jgi:hypothetical protein